MLLEETAVFLLREMHFLLGFYIFHFIRTNRAGGSKYSKYAIPPFSFPEAAILGADQKERGLWEREWPYPVSVNYNLKTGNSYLIS